MVKYHPELKAKVVCEYLSTNQDIYDLSKKYQIDHRRIGEWIQRYRSNGFESFKHRRHKRTFTAEFKLNVIDYYQTHKESTTEVAARLGLMC